MDPIHSDACPICKNTDLKVKYKKASNKRTLQRQKSRKIRGETFTKHDGGHEKKEDGGERESPVEPVISARKGGETLTPTTRGSKTVSTAMAHWCVSCEQGVCTQGECVIEHYKGHWRKRATDFFWITVLVVMFLEYTYVFKTIANVFGCFGIYKSKSSEDPSISYLLDDPNIMCYTPDHNFLQYIGLALMVLYGLGIPLAAFTILFQNREAIIYEEASYKPCSLHDWQMPGCESLTSCTCPLFDPNSAIRRMHPNLSTDEFMIRLKRRASQIDVRAKFGFLFEGFEKHGICPYWEVTVITLRKIAIMGIATGLQTFEVQLQTMFMMTVLFIAIMLHIQYEPYEYDSHDDLELWSLVAGMITLFIGMPMNTQNNYPTEFETDVILCLRSFIGF